MQYWISVVSYPVNVGGKPYHSWPSFIIVTFEMTILFAGISAVFGMLALNGLPMPYHPVFNAPRFAFATKDRFFLIVFSSDPKYNPTEVRDFLQGLKPLPSGGTGLRGIPGSGVWTRAPLLVPGVTTDHVGTAARGSPVERMLYRWGANLLGMNLLGRPTTWWSLAPLDSRGRLSLRGL